jgi:hypothetical protein
MKASTLAFRSSTEVNEPRFSNLRTSNTQPDLDLIEPQTVLWRVVEHDPMLGIAQKRRPALAIFQDAVLTLLTQLYFHKTRLGGHTAHQ